MEKKKGAMPYTQEHKNKLAKNLVKARDERKMQRWVVKEELGWKKSRLQNYENAISMPDVFSLNKLAKLYYVSVEKLIEGVFDDGK